MLEYFPATFSCKNDFNLSQRSLDLEDKNLVLVAIGFEKDFFLINFATKAADLSNLMRVLSLVPLLTKVFHNNCFVSQI